LNIRVSVNALSAIAGIEAVKIKAKEIMKRELIQTGLDTETDAKMNLTVNHHVITGNLRSSIHVEYQGGPTSPTPLSRKPKKELDVHVGSNVKYAHKIEVLDPYLVPAMEKNRNGLKERLTSALSSL